MVVQTCKEKTKVIYSSWANREIGYLYRGREIRQGLTDNEMRAFPGGTEIEVIVAIRHAEPDQCANCCHWSCVGRCALVNKYTDPMMPADMHCGDHERVAPGAE